MTRLLLALAALLALSTAARADDAKVAVAANFTEPAKKIAAAFTAATGDTVSLSFGASGQFVAEIVNGAPFDLLLSADIDHAKYLETAGLGVPGTRVTYATGHLVLWSANPGLVDQGGRVLSSGHFNHLAIADPKLAPYGLAAEQFLQREGLWTALQPKLVTGKSIAQAYQDVQTGNAELGFVALSQVKKQGSRWEVPDALHAPITQQVILLKHGAHSAAAAKFRQFLLSPPAIRIIRQFGYD